MLNPVFQAAMLQLNKLCTDVSGAKLFSVEPGHTHQLASFVEGQEERQATGQEILDAFAEDTLACITDACQASLDELEASLAQVRSLLLLLSVHVTPALAMWATLRAVCRTPDAPAIGQLLFVSPAGTVYCAVECMAGRALKLMSCIGTRSQTMSTRIY